MTKISFIGAGSTVFAKNLMGDILSYPELQDATISLFDIDPVRLRTSEIVAHKIADFFGRRPKSRRRSTAAVAGRAPISPSACSRWAATSPAP
jgi:alpha-galactosidase/6-phospho-beta-glucosidase family protein